MKIDLDEFGLDPDRCCYCTKDRAWTDRYGIPWCEDHRHRGELLNWGFHHQWPVLQCKPFAIGASEYFWYVAAVAGLEEFVKTALTTARQLEKPAPVCQPDLSEQSASRRRTQPEPMPSANAVEQEVARLRKEVRQLMPFMKPFFEENHHQPTQWESSGRMHVNGKISEKGYFSRVQNALRVGESETLRDVLEAIHRTLGQGVTP